MVVRPSMMSKRPSEETLDLSASDGPTWPRPGRDDVASPPVGESRRPLNLSPGNAGIASGANEAR